MSLLAHFFIYTPNYELNYYSILLHISPFGFPKKALSNPNRAARFAPRGIFFPLTKFWIGGEGVVRSQLSSFPCLPAGRRLLGRDPALRCSSPELLVAHRSGFRIP